MQWLVVIFIFQMSSPFPEIPDTISELGELLSKVCGYHGGMFPVLPSVTDVAKLKSFPWIEENGHSKYVVEVYNWSKKKQNGIWGYYIANRLPTDYFYMVTDSISLFLEKKESFLIKPFEIKRFYFPLRDSLFLFLFRESSPNNFYLEGIHLGNWKYGGYIKERCSLAKEYNITKNPWNCYKLCHDGYIFSSGSYLDVIYYFGAEEIEEHLRASKKGHIYLLFIPTTWKFGLDLEGVVDKENIPKDYIEFIYDYYGWPPFLRDNAIVLDKRVGFQRLKIKGEYKEVFFLRINSAAPESIKVRYSLLRCVAPNTFSCQLKYTYADTILENFDISRLEERWIGPSILVVPNKGIGKMWDFVSVKMYSLKIKIKYLLWKKTN
ncbi:MAG: hypothetical protein ABIN61_08555 [candidate division WOR-3 bacterium]